MSRCHRGEPVPEEVRRAAELLERRWLLSILFAACAGEVRFNAFIDAVAGISPRMLAERLRDLEAAGLVERRVIPDSPPSVEYHLTEHGRALRPVVEAVHFYARSDVARASRARVSVTVRG
jgi:DNA-binding HxlR family transcriptional regulator